MRRQTRLFALAEHLPARRTGVTAEALAERFGVTVRTIYRDLDSLRDASLPVTAERGRGGGYALDRAYTLPPVNFSPREAALLLTAGRYVTAMRLLPFADTLAGALDKVRGALDASAQRELVGLMDTLTFVGIPAPSPSPGVRAAIERAWFEQRAIALVYRDQDGVRTPRTVRIRSILFERTRAVLVCDDLDLQAERRFRVDRVESATVVGDARSVQPTRRPPR